MPHLHTNTKFKTKASSGNKKLGNDILRKKTIFFQSHTP